MKNNISVIVPLYNEERRIEKFLKALSWCDDVIVINKSSTDKTLDYCTGDNVNVITIPYTDKGTIMNYGKQVAKHDWIALTVVSDFISYELVKDVNNLINDPRFNDNTIIVPFNNYILGLNNKYSPWFTKYKWYFFKKSSLNFSDLVHRELIYDKKNIYRLQSKGAVFHLTHQSVESQLERHTRYAQQEAEELYFEKKSLTKMKFSMIKLLIRLFLKNNAFTRGNDEFMLGMAFYMYFIQRYLFTWEKYKDIDSKYENIKDSIINEVLKNKD